MNTLSPSSFLARLALRARRSKILVGLAAALAAPAVLFANSCSSDADYQSCHLEELRGNYLFTKDDVCGCERLNCDPSTRCFHGDCCNPQLYANDHDRCGCAAACNATEVCHDGLCCDPSSPAANSRTNCGCAGPCGDREDCQLDATGRYACVCNPILSLTNRDNCGCSGQACDPDTERCRQGKCECDPLAGPTQQDDTNCACRGECPYVMEDGKKTRTAYCGGGICHCFSADEVICDGVCKKQSDCTCDPVKHMSDTSQCACNGPCAAGDSCINGECSCNTLAHASDNLNCGCSGSPCDTANGYQCEQGTCACPAPMLNNNLNCGCSGIPCDTADGFGCSGGVCSCQAPGKCACDPSTHMSDVTNCACMGPCKAGDTCENGSCTCDPLAYANDNLNCGCSESPCNTALGYACMQGACSCPPSMLSDNANCGCSGTACDVGNGFACAGGVCVCQAQGTCACLPPTHMSDVMNCACMGPCKAGDTCEDGSCSCNALAHAGDNLNCGCTGVSCDTAHGLQCEQGICVCPAAMLSNNLNCGCTGVSCDAAPGLQCEQGICACPAPMFSNNLNCGCTGISCDTAAGLGCSGGVCVCPPERQTDPVHCGCPAVACGLGAICVNGTCGQCVAVQNMTIQPVRVDGSGDTEFAEHGPVVTVNAHISFDAAAHQLKIHACVDMVETQDDWTHGLKCQDQIIPNVTGSSLVSPADFMLKYTDTNNAQDDAIQKASSLLANPVILGVTCIGDTDGNDIFPGCVGPFCSGCSLQLGCVLIAP